MGALLSEPVTAMVVERAASESCTAAIVTMQGWRKTHEDAHIFKFMADGAQDCGVFAILDGHGGSTAAHVGARLLQERFEQLVQKGEMNVSTALHELFLGVDARLREQLPAEDQSGTTVVAAIVTKPRPSEYCVHIAHSGDSRAVLCLGGASGSKSTSLIATEDHKPSREDETQRILAAGGSVAHGLTGAGPLRVDGALAVSRALGDFQFKPPEMAPELCKVTCVPEVRTVTCAPGDWLFLACDGVFDVMTNEDLKEYINAGLQESTAEGGAMMVELLRLCLSKDSKDNCTACLVQLGTPAADGKPHPRTKELLQGNWADAPPPVRAKYAEFFSSCGFDEEANAVQATSSLRK